MSATKKAASSSKGGDVRQEQLGRRTLCALALATLLSGCTLLGPDFVTPDSQVAQQWIDTQDPRLKSEPTDQSEWWKVFDDSVLDSLIELAYEQNLPLRIAGLRILEARARLGIIHRGRATHDRGLRQPERSAHVWRAR